MGRPEGVAAGLPFTCRAEGERRPLLYVLWLEGERGMKCPQCGLFNPPSAMRCDCGWDFNSKTMRESYLKHAAPATSGNHPSNGSCQNDHGQLRRQKVVFALVLFAGVWMMGGGLFLLSINAVNNRGRLVGGLFAITGAVSAIRGALGLMVLKSRTP